MPTEAHEALIQRLAEEVFNQGNLDLVDELYAPTVVVNGEAVTVENLKQAIITLHEIIPGFRVTAEQVQAAGDKVAARWTIHREQWTGRGVEAMRDEGSSTGTRLFRVANGRIVEAWLNWDAIARLRQSRGDAGGYAFN